jgi:hypothetical protein
MQIRIFACVLLAASILLHGCVTHIKTDVLQNPAPAEKFSDFARVEMAKITLAPPYAGQEANEKALVKIQENVAAKMTPLLTAWNSRVPPAGGTRTLLIEPVVTEIKFINATSRVWAGAMAGSSAVILRVKLTEKETGRVIGEPHFYARAAAFSGATSFGAADNAMLIRVANRMADYLQANYTEAVGGRTGADPGK